MLHDTLGFCIWYSAVNQIPRLKARTSCIGKSISKFKMMKGSMGIKNVMGMAKFEEVKGEIDSELTEPAGSSQPARAPGAP